jgi:hypothetical protein
MSILIKFTGAVWSDLEQPQADPPDEGQDARRSTRFKRGTHVLETWHVGAGSSVVCASLWPHRAGVTCSRNRWFGAKILR